jgi:hypothetical protein
MRRWATLALVAMLVAACTPGGSEAPVTTSPTATTSSTTSTTAPPADGAEPCASGDLPFVEDGLVAALGTASGNAAQVSGIRWEPGATCERLTLSFTTESGAPATSLGPIGVSLYGFAGRIRVTLPGEFTTTVVADSLFDGQLLDRSFVARSESGDMFIDVLGVPDTAIAARAFATSSPATLVIDVSSAADVPSPTGSAVSDAAVIVSPTPGPSLYPFLIEAYAPPGVRAVRVQLSSNDEVAIDRSITLEGGTDAWQAFTTRVENGPPGSIIVFVGEVDGNGRPLEGATVAVDLP